MSPDKPRAPSLSFRSAGRAPQACYTSLLPDQLPVGDVLAP